jgi:hypothetical protein
MADAADYDKRNPLTVTQSCQIAISRATSRARALSRLAELHPVDFQRIYTEVLAEDHAHPAEEASS